MLANFAGDCRPESRASSCRHPAGHVFSSPWANWKPLLTLAELETLPRALLAVLLTFAHARIARKKTVIPESVAQIGIENGKSARNPHAHGARLASNATAIDRGSDVKLAAGIGELQRLDGAHQPRDILEIRIGGPAVYFKFSAARTNEHARHSILATAGTISLRLQNAPCWRYARAQTLLLKSSSKKYLSISSRCWTNLWSQRL